jgi:hypothetical protein
MINLARTKAETKITLFISDLKIPDIIMGAIMLPVLFTTDLRYDFSVTPVISVNKTFIFCDDALFDRVGLIKLHYFVLTKFLFSRIQKIFECKT